MTSLPEARIPVYFPALQVWKHVLRRWQRPTAQHDAHEFWGYLAMQANAPAFRGRWEARTLLPGALKRVEDSGCLLAGLTLPWLDHPASLQEALQSWCLQPAKHAMTSLPRALCLHLPRYRQENGVSKSFAPLHMAAEEVVHVPYFTGILQVAWAPYVLTAGVMHHGESLESGHYRCFLSLHGEWHVTDDGKGHNLSPRCKWKKSQQLAISSTCRCESFNAGRAMSECSEPLHSFLACYRRLLECCFVCCASHP